MKIMGLDIGGANTDYIIYNINQTYEVIESDKTYLPMWKEQQKLEDLLKKIENQYNLDVIIVTTTAELADGYQTKKEGIYDITQKVMNIFGNKTVKFVSFDGLKDIKEVKEDPLSIAAANWIATTCLISKIKENTIFMDMGTTTTDIIPVKNSHEVARGHSDLERLCNGELVYTGALRTNVATIVNSIPFKNKECPVSSEYFTITADVYSILNKINIKDYTCPTPDNNSKDVLSCKRRLARLLCSDMDFLSDDEITEIADYVYHEQIKQIEKGLRQVVNESRLDNVIITTYSNLDCCKKAAQNLNLNIELLTDYISLDEVNISPTVGAVQLYLDNFTETDIKLI